MQRIASWYGTRRRRTRIIVLVTPILLLLVSYTGVREVALRSADQLTITITQTAPSPTGAVIYRRTFGRALAAEAEYLLNDKTTAPMNIPLISKLFGTKPSGIVLNGSHVLWHYHLAFTWHGILIETADVDDDHLPETYRMSALGVPDLRTRVAETHGDGYSIIEQLAKDSGDSIPLPTTAA